MELEQKIREDWDARISLDPFYWMSEAYTSKQAMLESGKRDVGQLLSTYTKEALSQKTILEYGSGIGRIAYHVNCEKLLCVDISRESLLIAQELLRQKKEAHLLECNGCDLSFLGDSSLDIIYAHAVVSHIPRTVLTCILYDMMRVLKVEGDLVLQMYLGAQPVETDIEDTLTVRGYEENALRTAFSANGFSLEDISDLELPFDGSFHGMKPVIVRFQKISSEKTLSKQDFGTILHSGVHEGKIESPDFSLEIAMLSHRVEQCVKNNEFDLARATLHFMRDRTQVPEELAEIEKILIALP